MRQILSATVCLVLFAGVALADDKPKEEKGTRFEGSAESFKDGTLTLKVKGKDSEATQSKEFKIADDLKVVVWNGEDPKEIVAKDGLKDLKAGTAIAVVVGEDGKVLLVRVGTPPKKPNQ
jgi:hypothetical protein